MKRVSSQTQPPSHEKQLAAARWRRRRASVVPTLRQWIRDFGVHTIASLLTGGAAALIASYFAVSELAVAVGGAAVGFAAVEWRQRRVAAAETVWDRDVRDRQRWEARSEELPPLRDRPLGPDPNPLAVHRDVSELHLEPPRSERGSA